MLIKLSLRNVRRSAQDYMIYFLTLTFGVSLFYGFNAITAQSALLDLSTTQRELFDMLSDMIALVSLFIAGVLAFLTVYANNFLIRRRKRELGMYQVLGFGRTRMSMLLVGETFVIGLFALTSGLVVGVLAAQALPFFVTTLFGIEPLSGGFVVSFEAVARTVVYFMVVFLSVMLFNVISVNRMNALDLINAGRKSERVSVRSPLFMALLFAGSTAFIALSYVRLADYEFTKGIVELIVWPALIVLATFVWFFAFSGMLLWWSERNVNWYLRGLNVFAVRQLTNKLNTNFVSMAIISLLITGTATLLASGVGYKQALDEELKLVTPYDVTFKQFEFEGMESIPLGERITRNGVDLDDLGERVELSYYNTGLGASALVEPYVGAETYAKQFGESSGESVLAVRASDYEKLARLQGGRPLEISEDETIVFSNRKDVRESLDSFIAGAETIDVNGRTLRIKNEETVLFSIENTEVPRDTLMLVIPDNLADGLFAQATLLVANYSGDGAAMDTELLRFINEPSTDPDLFMLPYTRTYVSELSAGQTGSILFIAFYIGLVFLIAGAAVLAIQQLSEAIDSNERYRMLRRIGVSEHEMNRVVRKQLAMYFALPLLLAVSHAVFAVFTINRLVISAAGVPIVVPALLTGGLLLLVYGGYFEATYRTYRKMIH